MFMLKPMGVRINRPAYEEVANCFVDNILLVHNGTKSKQIIIAISGLPVLPCYVFVKIILMFLNQFHSVLVHNLSLPKIKN